MSAIQPLFENVESGEYTLILNRNGQEVTTVNYNGIDSECEAVNKYPVSFSNEDEFNNVLSLWNETNPDYDAFYIGAFRDGNEWTWLDGTTYGDYTGFWADGEPATGGSFRYAVVSVDSQSATSIREDDPQGFGIVCETPTPTPAPSMNPTVPPTPAPGAGSGSGDGSGNGGSDDGGSDAGSGSGDDSNGDGSDGSNDENKDSGGGNSSSSDDVVVAISVVGSIVGCCVLVGCAGLFYKIQEMQGALKDTQAQVLEAKSPKSSGEDDVEVGNTFGSFGETEGDIMTDPFAYGDEGGGEGTEPGTEMAVISAALEAGPGATPGDSQTPGDLLDTKVPGYEDDYMETGVDGEPAMDEGNDELLLKPEPVSPGFVPSIGSSRLMGVESAADEEKNEMDQALLAVKKHVQNEKDENFGMMLGSMQMADGLIDDDIVADMEATPGEAQGKDKDGE